MKEKYIHPSVEQIVVLASCSVLSGSDGFGTGLEDPSEGDNWSMQ